MKIRTPKQKNTPQQTSTPTKEAHRYHLKAECKLDADRICSLLSPYMSNWSMRPAAHQVDGQSQMVPGIELEFAIAPEGPDIAGLLSLIDSIPNCHVASDTLAPSDRYTGERDYRARSGVRAKQPSAMQLLQCTDAVDRDLRINQVERERITYQCGTLHAAHDKGTALPSADTRGPMPGWLLVARHGPSGATCIYRVDAMGGDPERLICGLTQDKARLLTLGA